MAQDLNANVLTHCSVTDINADEKLISTNNKQYPRIEYHQCVLATGATVNQLPLDTTILEKLYSINYLEDYINLQQKLKDYTQANIMIIGLVWLDELANDLKLAGHQVTVITNEAYPMGRQLPEALAKTFQKACEDEGIQFVFNACIKDIKEQANQLQVHYDDHILDADIVINIGFKPNVSLAEKAGLKINHGIVIDDQFRTHNDAMFAIGDCAEMHNFWRPYIAPILQGGKVLAKVLSGEDVKVSYPVMPVIAKTPMCKVQGVFDRRIVCSLIK